MRRYRHRHLQVRGGKLSGWALPALVGAAWLVSACTGEINGPAGGGPKGSGGGDTGVAPPRPIEEPAEPSDWFEAVQQADCSAPVSPARTRIRRLSTVQWQNTVTQGLAVALPAVQFPEDGISSDTGFNTDAEVNKVNVLLANAYFDAGEALGASVAAAAMQTYPCLSTTAADPACSAPFLKDYGSRLFRRPLTDEEVTRYGALLSGQAALDTADVAVSTVIRAFLLSPNMVYLTELGASTAGQVALTPFEQAALLSYTIADGPPDATLKQAAEQNALTTSAQRATHAQRLLLTPSARAKYADFWRQYLPLGGLAKATGLAPDLVTAMGTEVERHFDKIVWDEQGTFADLVTAPYTYGDATLSQIYGTLTPNGTGASTLPTGERSGFLTQAGFLFSDDASSVEHKIISRGLAVRARLLCQPPQPPPPNLMPQASDLRPLGDGATPLESYEAFAAAQPGCVACHTGFQPIGLAFEAYDNMGHYRTTYEDGRPIVTSGDLIGAGDATGPYANAVEIAGLIGNSKIGEYCFSRQFAEYALGRHLHAELDACVIRAPSDASAEPSVQQLAVVLSDVEAGSGRFHTP